MRLPKFAALLAGSAAFAAPLAVSASTAPPAKAEPPDGVEFDICLLYNAAGITAPDEYGCYA